MRTLEPLDPAARGAPGARPGPATPAVARLVTLLLVAGGFAVVLAGVRSELFDLDRYIVPKALALHAVALGCLALLLPSWERIEAGAVATLLVAFVAWSGVSALLAANRWLALHASGVSFSACVVFLAARRVAGAHGRLLVGALAAAAVLGGALGMAQAYGADWEWLAQSRPPGGTFGNRNFLAHLMAIATPLLVLARLRARGRFPADLALAGLAVAATAIILTRSRAAWLGLAAALFIMMLAALAGRRAIRASRAPRRIRGIVVALALGAAAAVVLPNQLQWRSGSPYAETLSRLTDYRGGSGRGRLIQYENSLRLRREAPVFGVGPGNWFVHYPRVTTPGDPAFAAHDPIPTNPWPSSDWVALLVERGAFAVLLLLLAGAAAALTALRRLRGNDPDAALGAAALLGTLAAVLVVGLFDAVLLLPAPAYFVAAAAGAMLPATRAAVSRPLRGRTRRLAKVGALVLAAALTLASAGQLAAILVTQDSSDRATLERALRFDPGNHRLRLRLMRRGPCSVRVEHARAAAKLMPHHTAPQRALRACGVRGRG